MPPLERWVSESGKVVIVGDAGHAMLPYANQVCHPEF
jgi:2-polyprenyl-6-methoxyphenol hydroxylase-like FAD-dependent oxidoreductase